MSSRRREDVEDDGLSLRERRLRRERDRLEAALDAEAAARTERIEAANEAITSGSWEAEDPPEDEGQSYMPMAARMRAVKRALNRPQQ